MSAARLGLALLGIGLVVAASGCVVDASGEKAVSTTVVTRPDPVPARWAKLEALLPDLPPVGFEKQSDGAAGAGAVDVRHAIDSDVGSDAETFFIDQAFEKGYQRRFVDSDYTRHVDVWVYEFETPEYAAAWFLRTVRQASESGAGLDASAIPNSSGGQRETSEGTVAVIAYPAGNRVVRVEAQDPEAAQAIARARDEAQLMLSTVPQPPT